MGIHGITGELARYPRLGKLRKGDKKPEAGNRPGRDLGEQLRFASDDPDLEREWFEAFGSLNVDELTVLLPYATVAECWQAWREDYGASALKVRCDGQNHVLWLDPKTGDYSDVPRPCPGESCQAKEVGRLDLLVLGFPRLGTVTMETTSLNDIRNLDGCLRLLAMQSGDLTQIPLRLCRVSRNISRPKLVGGKRTGERVRSPEWLLHIEPSPAWVRQRLEARRQEVERLITGTATMALPDNGPVLDAEYRQATQDEVDAHDARFTERIAACTLSAEVEGLLAEIAGIDNEFHRQNATRLAYTKMVDLALPKIASASRGLLAQMRPKLEALPQDTPRLNEALDRIIARETELVAAEQAEVVILGAEEWRQVRLAMIAAGERMVGQKGAMNGSMN